MNLINLMNPVWCRLDADDGELGPTAYPRASDPIVCKKVVVIVAGVVVVATYLLKRREERNLPVLTVTYLFT